MPYDAIIVGARGAGASLAMLLATLKSFTVAPYVTPPRAMRGRIVKNRR